MPLLVRHLYNLLAWPWPSDIPISHHLVQGEWLCWTTLVVVMLCPCRTHPWAWVIFQGRTGGSVHLGCLAESTLRNVSVDCKQLKITEVKLRSEEPKVSVDIGTVVLEKVKCVLVNLQKKFRQWELPQHSITLGGSHQNYSEGKWDHFAWLKKAWALKKKRHFILFQYLQSACSSSTWGPF